jgi:hypothetical protein
MGKSFNLTRRRRRVSLDGRSRRARSTPLPVF